MTPHLVRKKCERESWFYYTLIYFLKAHHFWSETETAAYVDWINRSLHDDTDLESILPISNEGTALFEACRDGLVLCKLVNSSVPNSIDEKALNKKPKSPIHKSENITKVLNGCRAIGIQVHNIGPEDIMKATPHLVLGLVWQIIKIGLLATINSEPLLTNGGSSVENLQEAEVTTAERRPKGPSANEKSLLSWLNKVLQQLGHEQKISNFGSDLSDSIALAKLVIYLTPEDVGPKLSIDTIQQEQDMFMRAEMVLDQANTFDCRQFATPNDIVSGSRNLNMAFVAVLYNTRARAAEAERKTRELQETLQNELVQAINRNEQQMQRSREEMEIIIQSLKQQLAQSEKGRAALEVDNETLNAQNEALNAKLLEEERRGELVASEELEALQEENTHLKSKIFSIEKESGEFRIYKINIEAKLELAATELKNYKASSDSQIAKLSDLLDAATSENFEMKGLLIEIEEDNSNVNNELSSLKAQLDVSKADLSHVKLESQQVCVKKWKFISVSSLTHQTTSSTALYEDFQIAQGFSTRD